MYKILLIIIGYVLSVPGLFAADQSTNMTSSGFMVDTGPFDPLSASHSSTPSGGPSAYTGKGALLFLLQKISELLLFMVPIIAIISLLIAGYYYIFSAGNSEKAGQAKNIIKWNLVAIVIAFMSWSIIQLIASLLSS